MAARGGASMLVPLWGFAAARYASPAAWVLADLFLVPAWAVCPGGDFFDLFCCNVVRFGPTFADLPGPEGRASGAGPKRKEVGEL